MVSITNKKRKKRRKIEKEEEENAHCSFDILYFLLLLSFNLVHISALALVIAFYFLEIPTQQVHSFLTNLN